MAEAQLKKGQKRCPGCKAAVGTATRQCKRCLHAFPMKKTNHQKRPEAVPYRRRVRRGGRRRVPKVQTLRPRVRRQGPGQDQALAAQLIVLGVGCGARVLDKDKACRKCGHPNAAAAFPSQCKDCGKPCRRRTDCCSICEEAYGARLQDAFEDGELLSAPASSVRAGAVAAPQPEPMPTGVPEPDEREERDDDAFARPKHVVGRPVDYERHCFDGANGGMPPPASGDAWALRVDELDAWPESVHHDCRHACENCGRGFPEAGMRLHLFRWLCRRCRTNRDHQATCTAANGLVMGPDRVGVPWIVNQRDHALPKLSWVEINPIQMCLPRCRSPASNETVSGTRTPCTCASVGTNNSITCITRAHAHARTRTRTHAGNAKR